MVSIVYDMFAVLACVWFTSGLSQVSCEKLPVIVWHGDHGTGIGIHKLAQVIEKELPGTYVKCITTSDLIIEDIRDTYFMPINDQLEYVCNMLRGLFVRTLVQKCPQQGVFGIPKCTGDDFIHFCLLMSELLSYGAYNEFVQSHLVQAQYWHDPLKEDVYRQYSQFLADANQENQINENYLNNLKKIKRLVLVKFLNDTIVVHENQNGSDSRLYTENSLSRD
ncbi:unnamed protein product [Heterobilharzia americana]|nr:unnamed protein product [Heterobilharzia americana]